MLRSRKVAIITTAAISLACCLVCAIVAPSIVRYQPAVVAAPGHEMQRYLPQPICSSQVLPFPRNCDILVEA
jgi:hypothetical protein